ncbi:MAG: citrate/2-methylcitrate synthase [Planctomycetota bacterium]
MRAKRLADLLKAGDRVAVSNVTGREASKVTEASQRYCGNITGGWALGKGGQEVRPEKGARVPVFATFGELLEKLPAGKRPNKVIVYSPPEAVYGEVKEVVDHSGGKVETIYIITEHVSIEVTAKVRQLCSEAEIDVIGCNTLGVINVHDRVRVGAVGGNAPDESFVPGSVTIISNSGNMVNTIASYLLSAGFGTSFGCSTGKDQLILTPPAHFLHLAADEPTTAMAVLYVEPGGLYEAEALEMMVSEKIDLPLVVYVAGKLAEGRRLSLGHAGAVVEGPGTSATGKMQIFDEYFGVEPFDPEKRYARAQKQLAKYRKGIRVGTLHDLPRAASLVRRALGRERDFRPRAPLRLNPWMVNMRGLGRRVPARLVGHEGTVPAPYDRQFKAVARASMGAEMPRRSMRSASHASSNDGATPRIYGCSLTGLMSAGSFGRSLILGWTGEEPREDYHAELVEKCLIAALANGPGTISAQGAKLSASAGNSPNTAMIATLASIGTVHGGNGAAAVRYLTRIFKDSGLTDPFYPAGKPPVDVEKLVEAEAKRFAAERAAAKEAGVDYRRIPCMGHPVYKDKPVNHDPREVIISEHLAGKKIGNVFLDFYHGLALKIREIGVSTKAWAVNVDAAIASVWLGITWPMLIEKRMTFERAVAIPFLAFALGRAAGGAAEYLDHVDFGTPMDMRIPASDTKALVRPKD